MKGLSIAIKVAFSILFMYLVLRQVDLGQTLRLFSQIKILYFLLAFAAVIPTIIAGTYKWQILLEVLGHRVPFTRLLFMYMSGFFFNTFFTGLGDIKRVMDLSRECSDPAAAAISVFMERWTGVFTLLAVAVTTLSLSVFVYPEIKIFIMFCLILIVLLILLYIAIERIGHYPILSRIQIFHYWIGRLRTALQCYRGANSALLAALALSLVTQVLLIITHYFVVKALNIHVSMVVLFIFIPTILIFAQVPISINGFGIQDMAFVKLLGISGLNGSAALSISLLIHMLRICMGAIGGVFYLLRPPDTRNSGDQGSGIGD